MHTCLHVWYMVSTYKFFPETSATLAGVVLPSTSRSIFLSRNSKLQQVLPRTYSSTSRGCAKQLAHDTFECNLTIAGRSGLQQVLPRTYSSTSGGRAKESHSVVECAGVRLHCKPLTCRNARLQRILPKPIPARAGVAPSASLREGSAASVAATSTTTLRVHPAIRKGSAASDALVSKFIRVHPAIRIGSAASAFHVSMMGSSGLLQCMRGHYQVPSPRGHYALPACLHRIQKHTY